MDSNKALVVFEDKKIRRTYHNEEWYFSVIDIVAVLTDSSRSRKYWSDLKKKLIDEGFELSDKIGQLKLPAADGKFYITDCANTESMFRIIQSIPSPKAEPFKRWLAKVGYERVQEIQNPELAQERMKQIYEQKGYSKSWIDKRLRGIAIRQELTDEWKNRDIKEQRDYAILTNEISMATFGKTVDQYKKYKQLKDQNLRDHMNDLELIFTMLGEKVITEITQNEDANGFPECRDAAERGGKVAGNARINAEKEIGKPIVSGDNYLRKPESVKRLEKKKE
ncbi:MAG: phage antirepressor protein [Candidatus Nanohalarchaeota archaeon]|nr:MAG: phage antirepressor protein [Candidatus Nanohaloarchaeota archaeon]